MLLVVKLLVCEGVLVLVFGCYDFDSCVSFFELLEVFGLLVSFDLVDVE